MIAREHMAIVVVGCCYCDFWVTVVIYVLYVRRRLQETHHSTSIAILESFHKHHHQLMKG
ncbi:hypothetical protein DERF_001260 [Dermatophagoides farinae]|uniref:Uncharacterized protein n=1 Tax=Dermatophagoides farinae TaxID=6954 RepID=A0A922L974_DERFA|nr:hypothetical protein DERF_001260 [Dermatophagoides farinae]